MTEKYTKKWFWEEFDSNTLCTEYFSYFNEWWDPKIFEWNYSWALAEYCSEHFETWWDPKKYWTFAISANRVNDLYKKCMRYKNRWNPTV